MVHIEYDGKNIMIPTGWGDITLGDYERFYKEKPATNRGRVALIAQVVKIDAETLLSWPAEVFNLIVEYVKFIYGDNPYPAAAFTEIDGVTYHVPGEDDLTLGMYVDAEEAQKGPAELSNMLAIVCRPAGEPYDPKNNDARAAMFAAAPVSKVLGVMAFFLHCKTTLDAHTQVCGNLQAVADLLPRNTVILRNLGGGIKLSRIWQVIRFCVLTTLLRARLRKFSPSYSTKKTRRKLKTRNAA